MLKLYARAALTLLFAMVLVIFAAKVIGGGLDENTIAYVQMDILSATAFSAAPGEVALLDIERTLSVNLTRTPDWSEIFTEWSPDGRYILFDRYETVGISVCVIAPFESAVPRCLELPPRLLHEGWAADSETIYVRNLDTNQIRTASVITGQYSGDDVAEGYLSPDERFRVTYDEYSTSAYRVFDTATDRLWTPLESVMFSSPPVLTADGTRMVYSAIVSGTSDSEIYAIETKDDSTPTRITDAPHSMEHFPIWSPDGEWIVYTSTLGGFGRFGSQLYLMRADGSETRRLTFDRAAHTYPSWRP